MTNYRLPAEWEPQSGVMLVWPHPHGDWKHNLDAVEKTYLAMVSAICAHEVALIVCFDDSHREHIKQLFNIHHINKETIDTSVRFALAASNDSWVRDTGPITVVETSDNKGSLLLLDFTFNGWGEKYPANLDNKITKQVTQAHLFEPHRVLSTPLVLEGGSIESDGHGTLLTTSSCLSNPNRNPNLSREDIEQALQAQLGAERILWLHHGHIAGDDTDGHIDTLARFCSPDTIAYTCCEDTTDIHYASLSAMEAELSLLKTSDGKPYQLVPLPIPAAIHNSQGERLPANYANFLIINGVVLVPTYDDPNDAIALRALAACFPDREIIGIDCRSLVHQFGSLHCATMQLPFGVLT